ncbi:MAG: MMPL family transporter [Bacteroidales bacterium]|nr:MMPL family transporter [Bacteroidales bacterium]
MEKLALNTIKLRWWIIIITVIITAFLGYQIKNLRINADIISALPDNDPDAALLKNIGANFGGNSLGIIILETDNIYQTEVLDHIRILTDTVTMIDGISSVTSLTNIINIKRSDFGIEIGKLVDEYELPELPEELEELKNNVLAKDMYRGTIVSEDGTSTLIIFAVQDDADVRQVAGSVIDKTTALQLPEKLYYVGSPMLISYISDLMKADLTRLLPIAFLVIAFVLLISFRSFRGVFLPLLSAVIAIIWTLGIMALFGFKMSMISNNIPIILLAVGSAYAIHVVNRINQLSETNRKSAIIQALSYVMVPVMLAAITTFIGFVSFIFGAYLEIIVDFGIFTALGTLIACLLSIFLVPSLIASFSSEKRSRDYVAQKIRKSYLSDKFLVPLYNLLFRHPKYILVTWIVLIILSIAGIFFIERSVDIREYFKEGNPTRMAENIMIEKFGGTKPVFVTFEGDIQSPELLKMMISTGEYMIKSPDIYSTQSVADLVLEINYLLDGQKIIPDDRDKIEQLWFLLDGNEVMHRFVSEDLDEAVLMSKFKSPDNIAKKNFAAYMEKFIEENSTEECIIKITGMPFVDVTMDRSLLKSQIGSLSIALICVIIFVGIILRSLKSGIFATIPILAAILILFGVMGFAGISLNIATVLVASVALGIGIDYSIHVISHFNHTFRQTGDVRKSISETLMISGKAIIINVLAVSTGFLVLIFSEMVPLKYFGFLIALSMIGSSLGALTLLPVILILGNRKKVKT